MCFDNQPDEGMIGYFCHFVLRMLHFSLFFYHFVIFFRKSAHNIANCMLHFERYGSDEYCAIFAVYMLYMIALEPDGCLSSILEDIDSDCCRI